MSQTGHNGLSEYYSEHKPYLIKKAYIINSMKDNYNKQYPTYSGSDPYVFFSYAHKDMEKIVPIIDRLYNDKYRLWYDAGIEVGANWPEVVASHLLNSKTVILFISESFLKSQNCRREVNYAVSEKKEMYCVFLENVNLPEDMGMQLSTVEKLYASDMSSEQIAENIERKIGSDYLGDGITGYETIKKKKTSLNIWRIVSLILALLLLASGVFIYGYFNDWFTSAGTSKKVVIDEDNEEVEIAEFKDTLSKQLMLNSYDGDALYLAGNYMVSDAEAIRYKNGKWFVVEEEVSESQINDLSVIGEKEIIQYLALVNENIDDLSVLSGLKDLLYLDVSGNPLSDLSFVKDMKELRILKIIDTDIKDCSILNDLEHLRYLYVSLDMYETITATIDPSEVDIIVK